MVGFGATLRDCHPLLDWTTNPLTALFFACLDHAPNTDGCVFQCSRTVFADFNEPPKVNPFRDDRLIPGLIDATAMNTRTLAQDSAMSVHSGASPTLIVRDGQGETFGISNNEKSGVLSALRRFGFSSERLFADLATAAQEFKAGLLADEALGLIHEAEGGDEDDMDLDLKAIFR
ncbi:hypothetical protein QP162_12705 [Sphingomonas aurantiaca]|uniref:hypothetical protein n=1 Tax=Sphingomonas aurantiaca TaxID=185949 RepID=UPI002FE25E92